MTSSNNVTASMKAPAFIDSYGLVDERLTGSMYGDIAGLEIFRGQPRDEDEIIERIQGRRNILVYMAYLSEKIFGSCPDLRSVSYLSTGLATRVDLVAAERFGVRIEGVKGYGDRAVAEHAITLALSALKQVAFMDRRVRRNEWELTPCEEIAGKTFGVIGLGGIGSETARIAHALGARVLCWSRSGGPCPEGTLRASLDDVLQHSDILSLHLALTPETTGFIDARSFAKMKPGLVLVNTARAAIVDEAAMMDALAQGRIGHLALDVFHTEPPSPDNLLLRAENVTLTAHSAWMTTAAIDRLLIAGFRTLARHTTEFSG